MKNNKNGYVIFDCIVTIFIIINIVFIITVTLHNNFNLLDKNEVNSKMLKIAKEELEDNRQKIKYSEDIYAYDVNNDIGDFIIKTTVRNTDFYKCYNLNVKVISKYNEMELNTYVTQK